MNGVRDEQIVFTSPKFYDDGYPLSQKCTWLFAAPEKEEVHIDFLEMNIEVESGDVIKIYSNWKSDAPAWTINNKYPHLKAEGYGETRFLLMVFQSRKPDSSKRKFKGFRGVFKAKGGGGKRLRLLELVRCLFRHLVLKENKQKSLEMRMPCDTHSSF